jgi:hypothetical protein
MIDWLPIRTAPRDGRLVRIARDMGEPWGLVKGLGYWVPEFGGCWVPTKGDSEIPGVLGLGSPALWMPLPLPPDEA